MATIPLSYYFDWQGLEDFRSYSFDANGIPRVHYGSRVGLRYNAITIAQYGLYRLQQYDVTADKADKQKALACAHWLTENASTWSPDSLCWIYDFDLPFYHLRAPWISAMAQGEAVSLLLRAFMLDDHRAFLDTAAGAVRAFLYPVTRGGVCDYLDDGSVIFQEYPTSPPAHVLNGHIFALLGIYDYARFFDDASFDELCRQGIASVEKHWRRWDTGYWTRYDLHPSRRLASRMYHELHIRQMKMLSELFGNTELNRVAGRWKRMQKSVLCGFRWLMVKSWEKVRLARVAK